MNKRSKLINFYRGTFGLLALVFLLSSVETTHKLFNSVWALDTSNVSVLLKLSAIALLALAKLLYITPPILAALYGGAWWTLRTGTVSARRWSIAASVATLILCIPQLVAIGLLISDWSAVQNGTSFLVGILALCGAMGTFGIIGLVAFRQNRNINRP